VTSHYDLADPRLNIHRCKGISETHPVPRSRRNLKLNSIAVIYVLAAIARLLYALEGTMAHYTIHSDIDVASYLSAGVGIVIAIALLIPLSRRLAILFAGISVVSGIIGFAVMGWIYMTEGESNPVTAPLVGAIVFSALLYLKPRLTQSK